LHLLLSQFTKYIAIGNICWAFLLGTMYNVFYIWLNSVKLNPETFSVRIRTVFLAGKFTVNPVLVISFCSLKWRSHFFFIFCWDKGEEARWLSFPRTLELSSSTLFRTQGGREFKRFSLGFAELNKFKRESFQNKKEERKNERKKSESPPFF
jgi:hypothetical protein